METFGWVMFYMLCGAGVMAILAWVQFTFVTWCKVDDLTKRFDEFQKMYWDRREE